MTITELARRSISYYLQTGRLMSVPAGLPSDLARPAAAFVSLHRADGMLRGCIGTTSPTQPSLAAEVIANAVAAAVDDPRFEPLTTAELPGLRLSVDVLTAPQPVLNQLRLDPETDGIIVSASRGRYGVLLPRLDGIDTVDLQIAICRDKAGIGPDEPISLQSFRVVRSEEMYAQAG